MINDGLVHALYDYQPSASSTDELQFVEGDRLTIVKRGDDHELHWWWAKHCSTGDEGYVPRNYLGVSDRTGTCRVSSAIDTSRSRLALCAPTTSAVGIDLLLINGHVRRAACLLV
jgi:hypothetical protein